MTEMRVAEDLDDGVGQITYVIQHYDSLPKETINSVLMAALAEIMDLRIAVASSAKST